MCTTSRAYGLKLTVPCRIRILGVAPGASLVGLNVIGSSFTVFTSVLLEAIDYAVTKDHVNVINESFGFHKYPDIDTTDLIETSQRRRGQGRRRRHDRLRRFWGHQHDRLAGERPAHHLGRRDHHLPRLRSDRFRRHQPAGIKGWIDNNISGLSSGGFDQTGHTVDVVAPGDLNWALCSPKPRCVSDAPTAPRRA